MATKDKNKTEFGDWQTNDDLALSICRVIKNSGISPQVIIEPTCGRGSFLFAALETFDSIEEVWGIDINQDYIKYLEHSFEIKGIKSLVKTHLIHGDIFKLNFHEIQNSINGRKVLIIGNPPWVTNSTQGGIKSENLPQKSNIKGEKGLDAITGKSNFDIAEFITIKLIETFHNENAHLVFLLKNQVIKNLTYLQKNKQYSIAKIQQLKIDAKKEFEVCVSASVLRMDFGTPKTYQCCVEDFYTQEEIKKFGWEGTNFVSNLENYKSFKDIDGVSPLIWRSGVKHDCSKVMELTLSEKGFYNGLGEKVDIEEDAIYPLLKSSDISKHEKTIGRKFVIVTQHSTNEDTQVLAFSVPKTYNYLKTHATFLDSRKSSIYKNRPRFSLFGIGEYSFQKYKVAISGMYKNSYFALISPYKGKPVMCDDTCYSLGFDDYDTASVIQKVLNGKLVQSFIASLSFEDSKRVINKDLLMRIDLRTISLIFTREELGLSSQEYTLFRSLFSTNQLPLF